MEKTKIHVLYQKLWNFDLLLKKNYNITTEKNYENSKLYSYS